MASSLLTARSVRTPRHTTHYWDGGPSNGPLMIFLWLARTGLATDLLLSLGLHPSASAALLRERPA